MRKKFNVDLAFSLMNSFATSNDTNAYLKKYNGLASGALPLEFVQNRAPKVPTPSLEPDFSRVARNTIHEWGLLR